MSTRKPRTSPRRPTAPPTRSRLRLESLEDRTVFNGDPAFLWTPLPHGGPQAVDLRTQLTLWVDETQVPVPAGLGVSDAGVLPVHTDEGGELHAVSPEARDFRLGDFFALWGQSLSSDEFLGRPVDGDRPLVMTVNGAATTDLADRVLRDGDRIEIRYGTSAARLLAGNALVPEYTGPAEDLDASLGVQARGKNNLPAALNPPDKADGPDDGVPGAEFGSSDPSVDPATAGPHAVRVQEYTFGDQAFLHSTAALGTNRSEMTARVYAPDNLNDPRLPSRLPLVVLLHGRHATRFVPPAGGGSLGWPPTGAFVTIPSYQGYDYLGNNLASHGYIVVSISANAINTFDNGFFNPTAALGALARAELIQRHLDVWRDLNATGTVTTVSPRDTFTGSLTPFGNRFVGKVDLQNVGTMGHSRGGEGVVRHFALNQSLGSPYGIKAVFPLAPVNFARTLINNVPMGVLLPYVDGDVSDLQGVHFFDDTRYNVPGDLSPKHSFLVLGANHNFYNTVWTPGEFPFPGAPSGAGGTGDDGGSVALANRLNAAQQRATGLVIMSSFFRTYLGGERQFLPMLKGDTPPPASAQTDRIYVGYHGPDSPAFRLDVNRTATLANLTTNTLGGAVTSGGLTQYLIYGGDAPQQPFFFPGEPSGSFPHTVTSALSNRRGLSQLVMQWENTYNAFWQNDLPAAFRNVSGYYALELRAIIDFTDTRSKQFSPGDFSIVLTDGQGNSASTQAGLWSRSLIYPPIQDPSTPGSDVVTPHNFMNDIRVPLTAFAGVNLADVRSIRLAFDQRAQGRVSVTDLQFADPANLYGGPFVTSLTPPSTLGPISSLDVGFSVPVDPATFDASDVTVLAPNGTPVPVTGVAPIPGTTNARYTISFDPLGGVGQYTVLVGPDVRDPAGRRMDQNVNGTPGQFPQDRFQGNFVLRGPRVVASTLNATPAGAPPSSVRVAFNTLMDPTTFTPADVTLTGPGGVTVPITDVAAVPESGNTEFVISFATLNRLGAYTLAVGPQVFDVLGNPMDQDDDLTPGEATQDRFTATFSVVGPRVTAVAPASGSTIPAGQAASTVRLTFNRAIDPATFDPSDIRVFTRTSGPTVTPLTATAVVPVAGSNNLQFDVTFPAQGLVGLYTLSVGPNILDTFGIALDQNNNFTPGEDVADRFTTTFFVRGPRVIAVTPTNGTLVAPGQSTVLVTFDRPMDPTTFTAADVAFTRTAGGVTTTVPVTGVAPVAGSTTQFLISFAAQSSIGAYRVVVGPDVRDTLTNPMDQDNDLIPGEATQDQFVTNFTIAGPRVIGVTPSGAVSATPVNNVRVTFDRAMDPATFTAADVTLTGPGGAIPVTSVAVVAGSGNTQYQINFANQTARGGYTTVIGPDVRDTLGQQMDQNANGTPGEVPADRFTSTFVIPIVYTAAAATFETNPLVTPGGTLAPGAVVSIAAADDTSAQILLGADRFNFYGVTYDRVFVSSNGLITFGSGEASFSPTNLLTFPAQASIAVLWSDWIKSTSNMVVHRFETVGSTRRLVVEWNRVEPFPGGGTPYTFQAILELNTGGGAGAITLNYVDLGSVSSFVSVGVKDVGTTGTQARTLVHFPDGGVTSTQVQSGRAIRLTGA